MGPAFSMPLRPGRRCVEETLSRRLACQEEADTKNKKRDGPMQTIASPESLLPTESFEETLANDAAYIVPTESFATAKQQVSSTDISSRFGARLRELRRERDLTQLRMATEFGIDRSFISDVERGRKSISLPMLEVIALGMKIGLSELLRGI
jgi:DNA-binding XRE family transcriptional regulator